MKKHIILFVSLLLFACLTGCANKQQEAGAQDETTAQTTGAQSERIEPTEYESLAFENPTVLIPEEYTPWLPSDADWVLVNSNDELSALNLSIEFSYSDDFFEENALALIQFTYSNGEDFSELSGIVLIDGKLCPVLTIDSQEDLSDDFEYALISAEVKKADVKDRELGDNLIINRSFPDYGSRYHEKFDGTLK